MKRIFLIFSLIFIAKILFAKENPIDAVKVSYSVSHKSTTPGDTIIVDFKFRIKKGWHIYWINPGDAGLPTNIKLIENNNARFIDVLYPIPKVLREDDLVFYCYENDVTLPVIVEISKNSTFGDTKLQFEIDWLVCKKECYPGKAKIEVPLQISNHSITSKKINVNNYPKKLVIDNDKITAIKDNDTLKLIIKNYEDYKIDFFPINEGVFSYNKIEVKKLNQNHLVLLPLDKFREKDPEEIDGLFVFRKNKSQKETFQFYSKIKIKEE